MLTNTTQQLFESVARSYPQLREYLRSEYDKQVHLLVNVTDSEQMRRLQGHAQRLHILIGQLDGVPSPSGHRAGSQP